MDLSKHSFTQDLLLVNEIFDQSDDLVAFANSHDLFLPSKMANGKGSDYRDEQRTSSSFEINTTKHPELAPYLEEIKQALKAASDLYLKYSPFMYYTKNYGFEVLRYRTGEKFNEHIDVIYEHPVFKERQLSMLLYLNDDYQGGETRFARQNLQLKPPKGSMALFPPHYTHPHSSEPIISGEKVVVVSWLY